MDVKEMRIIVEEEYGYRYWLWETLNTPEFIEDLFESTVKKEGFYCSGYPKDHIPVGIWKEISWQEYKSRIDTNTYDAHAHIHQDDDSHISFPEL